MRFYSILSSEAGRLFGLVVFAGLLSSAALAGPGNLRRELWRSENLAVADGSGLAASDTLVFAYAGDGVAAFSKADGSTAWQSPALESSAAFGSTSSPLYVEAEGQVAIGSGLGADGTLYLLDAADGSILHQAPLGKAVVNASPAYANGLYYIKSFPDFGVPGSSSLFAVRASDGGIEWRADDGGSGGGQPVVEAGVVYDLIFDGASHEVRAYDAATGATIWTSSAMPDIEPFGGVSLADGFLYFGTNDFLDGDPGAPSSELFKLDASDGSLAWEVPAAATNGTPLAGASAVYSNGAFSYGQLSARSLADGSALWTRPEGYWNTSPALDGGVLYFCGDPEGGLGDGPHLYAVDADTGLYLDSVHRPYAHGTPLAEAGAVYIAGGGFVRAFGEAPGLVKIEELFVSSVSQDYLILRNASPLEIDLAGWRVEVHQGDGMGYALAATLPSHILSAEGTDLGDRVLIGAETNPLLGQAPEIDLASFDLPGLFADGTAKGVRLVSPSGDVIDTATYLDGTATGEDPSFAPDDTGQASAERAFAGLAFGQAMRRAFPEDTNDSSADFEAVGFPSAAADWALFE